MAPAQSIQLHGSGPDKSRQQSSHPHQAVVYEKYQELLVPDLGSDSVWRFKRNDDGLWQLIGHVGFEAGGGPRHVALHGKHLFSHFILYLNLHFFSRWLFVYDP
jgi:6-phosphogluconolactonase (cycloisomerase 2 family)